MKQIQPLKKGRSHGSRSAAISLPDEHVLRGGGPSGDGQIPAPFGKRVVIQFVSGRTLLPVGQKWHILRVVARLLNMPNLPGGAASFSFVPTLVGRSDVSGRDDYVISAATSLQHQSGAIEVYAQRNSNANTQERVEIAVAGYSV